jgi:hypothetical protein
MEFSALLRTQQKEENQAVNIISDLRTNTAFKYYKKKNDKPCSHFLFCA